MLGRGPNTSCLTHFLKSMKGLYSLRCCHSAFFFFVLCITGGYYWWAVENKQILRCLFHLLMKKNYHYLNTLTFTSVYHVLTGDTKSIYSILAKGVLFPSRLLLLFLLPLSPSSQINYHKNIPFLCVRRGKQNLVIKTKIKKAFLSKKESNFFGDEKEKRPKYYIV